jgi:glycosyltransferase involved in cell wall biosynthesis
VRSLRATTAGYNVELVIEQGPGGPSQAWNEALRRATGDPIVLAADDLVFRDGWLRAALRELASFPGGWGVVGWNDGHFGEELSTHFLVSRRLIREAFDGVIAWDDRDIDVEACARARAAGRYAWCSDAHVDHVDWRFGDRLR